MWLSLPEVTKNLNSYNELYAKCVNYPIEC